MSDVLIVPAMAMAMGLALHTALQVGRYGNRAGRVTSRHVTSRHVTSRWSGRQDKTRFTWSLLYQEVYIDLYALHRWLLRLAPFAAADRFRGWREAVIRRDDETKIAVGIGGWLGTYRKRGSPPPEASYRTYLPRYVTPMD